MNLISERLDQSTARGFRAAVGFTVKGRHPKDSLRVELTPFDPDESVIRITGSDGSLLHQEVYGYDPDSDRLEITVSELDDGVYYFEINDGFYHQVKEVRIPLHH